VVFTPTLSTIIRDAANAAVTSVNLGTAVHDTAALTGASGDAGGTVTYRLFNNLDCSGTAPISTQTVTVTNGVVPNTAPFTVTSTAGYSYLASYSGDTKGSNPRN